MSRRRLVVGISGATGIALGVKILELARAAGLETHLVVSAPAQLTRARETGLSAAGLAELADASHRPGDVSAAIASGSFPALGMIVAPCSARSLAAIAYGTGVVVLALVAAGQGAAEGGGVRAARLAFPVQRGAQPEQQLLRCRPSPFRCRIQFPVPRHAGDQRQRQQVRAWQTCARGVPPWAR